MYIESKFTKMLIHFKSRGVCGCFSSVSFHSSACLKFFIMRVAGKGGDPVMVKVFINFAGSTTQLLHQTQKSRCCYEDIL